MAARPFVNIAAYRFASLEDLKSLRAELLVSSKEWRLKGTILLSPEGINLFVAGEGESVERLLARLRAIPGLEDLAPKYSESDEQPFRRMLVRIKREIIAFGVEGIDPARRTSPKLSAKELKAWLDEGRPVTLLDTRNDYEVKLGTFENAVTLDLDTFRNFPKAVETLPEELKEQPVVMFCTGGIRCEKAGPFMESVGYRNILQLDGGILKYFEECGGDHFQGECFVFDRRVGVDPGLAETDNTQCFQCLAPLTPEDQADPRYVYGRSCPHCHETPAAQTARTIAEREAALRTLASPLPGSEPYENLRPFHIPARYDGQTLLDALAGTFDHVPRGEWLELCAGGRFLNDDDQPVPADQRVRGGECYRRRMPVAAEPDVNAAIRILHEDEALVIVDKPAPLPVHPSGRFNRNTLLHLLNEVYAPQVLRPVHRLDANTTGVMVLARTRHHASRIQPQFALGEVAKTYLARVQGHPPEDRFACDAAITSEPGNLGSRDVDPHGLAARTEFEVLERFADGTALLRVRPLTGRTNQIRVHLWTLGWPISGEQAYVAADQLGDQQTHAPGDAPLCLHALSVEFTHPISRERVRFEAPPPAWAIGKNS